jgi:hypothetical protein
MSDSTRNLHGDGHELDAYRVNQRYLTLRTIIRGGCSVVVAYYGFEALKALAGESTRVDVALSLVLSAVAKLEVVILLSLTGVACAWAVVERTLRHRKVERLQGRIRELETRIDPNRSSSGLTPAGRTRPEDRRK